MYAFSLLVSVLITQTVTSDQRNQHIRLDVVEKVVTNAKGEGHYKVNSYKFKADYGTDLKLNLTNLFRNNPVISANILDVLNANAKHVAQEMGGPILDYAIGYAMNVTQKFFDAYTYDQLSKVPLTEDFFVKEDKTDGGS